MESCIVFRDHLLTYSETWLLAQAGALKTFSPCYAGFSRIPGLPLPEDRTVTLAGRGAIGRLRTLAYRYTRFDPAFVRTLKKTRPALVHAHFEGGGLYALPLAAALGVPLITTCHGIDVTEAEAPGPFPFKSALRRRRRRDLWRQGTLFIAVSRYIREKMIARGYPEERTVVHYIGTDRAAFAEDPSIPREPIILFAGRLVEKKGCEFLIRAFAHLQNDLPRAELVIIGDGPLRGALELLASQTSPRIRFVGSLPPADVRAWMNRARVFCVPSVTAANGNSEGLPIVFCEAQAMGLPIVSTRHAGIPEIVEDGKTGFLAGERDPEAMAAGILRLMTDDALWQEFSAASKRNTAERFDLAAQTRRLEELYRDAIAAHAHARTSGAAQPALESAALPLP